MQTDQTQALTQSRQTTLAALAQIDDSTLLQLSQLTLPEIQSIKEEIAQVFPAGNLPAFVLSGLVKLKGRRLSPSQVSQDITALFRGISLIPQGLYGVFVAGPAAVLYAYQKLLQLAGQDPASAFPQGAWQFYLQFGLREDTARHANETTGFYRAFPAPADPAALAAAWVCASMELIYRYDDLLAADWAERVMLRLLTEQTEAGAALTREWNKLRPYHRPKDGSDYIHYRESVFQHFIQKQLDALPAPARNRLHKRYQARVAEELAAYQEQMTLLAALKPDRYQEHKEPIPLWQASIAFIWQGHTYLLSACRRDEQACPLCFPPSSAPAGAASPIPLYLLPGGELGDASGQPLTVDRSGRVFDKGSGRLLGHLRPPAPEAIQGWLAAILSGPGPHAPSMLDMLLVASPRSLQPQLRDKLPDTARAELEALRHAPIILNWDSKSSSLPLAYIRRGRRGVGDHALTIFRTERSMVFDQSHIFFDGMWGMAVAEILTDSAIYWYGRLEGQPVVPRAPAPVPLALTGAPEAETLAGPHRLPGEAAAEAGGVDMRRAHRLRAWLAQRGAHLTINDLLLLYRSIHAARYQPSPPARRALEDFRKRAASPQAQAAYQSIQATLARAREVNPSLLIPIDASNVSPRERIFPTIFRNPLTELDAKITDAQKHHLAYRAAPDARHWRAFDKARRELLAYLKAFGELLDTVKAVTMRGESFNTATIRLLAHLPASMQHLLDQIPQHIGILNEIIKGNEVFSNVGRVAPGASLTRFISAKDDGQAKELVWGIMTDNQDQMQISLRDLRPFVPVLLALGEDALADTLAQDYVASYVKGFNRFGVELSALISAKAPEKG